MAVIRRRTRTNNTATMRFFRNFAVKSARIIKDNHFFLSVVAFLLAIGLCWVSSATQLSHTNRLDINSPLKFSYMGFVKQLASCVVGIVIMFMIASANLKRLKDLRFSGTIYFVACILLIITMFMPPILGSHRWIPLGFINLQTAEFAKIAIVIFVAAYIGNHNRLLDMQQNSFKVFYPFILSGFGLGLIAIEPDIGIPALTLFAIFCMMYVAGVSAGNLGRVAMLSIPVFAVDAMVNFGHRLGRIQSFVMSVFSDQKVDIQGDAYQILNSLVGICSGGLFGRGIGNSHQKTNLLSQGDCDFIFSVYAEETGLVGSPILIGLFALLVYFCYKITMRAKDPFCRYLAVGFSFMLTMQSLYSIAVNANFAPVKGIALPFISSGGSSLVSTLIIIGIMLNIASNKEN